MYSNFNNVPTATSHDSSFCFCSVVSVVLATCAKTYKGELYVNTVVATCNNHYVLCVVF